MSKKENFLKSFREELYLEKKKKYTRAKYKKKTALLPRMKQQQSSINEETMSTKKKKLKTKYDFAPSHSGIEETSESIVEEDIHAQVPCLLNLEEGETFHAEAINLQESAVPLELYLRRVHDDLGITDSELNNIEDMHLDGLKIKKHAKRMGQIAVDWDEHWDEVFDAHIESFATIPSICWNCKKFLTTSYIRCLCCARTFCPHCDIQFHSWNVFHQREVLGNSKLVKLRSRDFWDEELSVVVQKDVAVPCFIPSHCQSCQSINTLTLEPLKNKYMIVVTLLGRFDLNAASFTCHNPACGATNEASVRNYVNAGYWPGSPTRTCTLFSQTYMIHWFHTKHQIPSTAATKYIEVSGKMSSEGGRNPVINPVMFRTASSQFSYIQHNIDVDVKLNEFMRCKACVLPCKYCHFDVIFKLYRYKAARSGHLQSLFEDSVIVSDAKIQSYVEEINKLKPQKGYDNCGNSTYKAGKENTSRHRTQDETGLGSACCRHGVVLVTANLKSGENYRVVNFFQHFLWTLGYVYFCYDVICNYGKFLNDLVKVSEGHEMHAEWMRMSKEMTGFLSVLHGRTHTWDCQVENNGRWRDWACASLGEEQEQVFARFARYGLVTKHMSPASRNDHLSEMVVYHNKEKDYGMDYTLVKRAKKAALKEGETLKKLAAQLSRRGLTEQDLPGILKKLQQLAKDKKNNEANPEDFKNQGKAVACEEEALVTTGKRKEKILPNSYKVDLEGHFMTAAWARKMMNKYGDTTSERDKFRFKMQEANGKATALMLLINEQSQYKITQEMYGTGSFPWNETTEINLSSNYNLIDTWMMTRRWKEEVIQTKNEMKTYLESLADIHSRLQDDIGIHTAIVDSWQDSSLHQDSSYPEWIQVSRGKLVLINAELDRLKWKVGRAIKLFRRYTYGDPDEEESNCDFDTDSSSQYHSDSSSDDESSVS